MEHKLPTLFSGKEAEAWAVKTVSSARNCRQEEEMRALATGRQSVKAIQGCFWFVVFCLVGGGVWFEQNHSQDAYGVRQFCPITTNFNSAT